MSAGYVVKGQQINKIIIKRGKGSHKNEKHKKEVKKCGSATVCDPRYLDSGLHACERTANGVCCGDHYALLTAGNRCVNGAAPKNENYFGVRTLYNTYACELTTFMCAKVDGFVGEFYFFHIILFSPLFLNCVEAEYRALP